MPQQSLLRGALFIIASELMFASMGATVKAASAGLPPEVLVFMRNLTGLAFMLPLLLRSGGAGLRTTLPHLHLLRAMLGLSAMYCFYYVLGRMPLADGVLLKMTAPIFIPLVAALWLQERPGRLALLAIPVGFAGVVLVLDPTGEVEAAALVGLLGGLFAAAAKVTVRRLGRSEPATRTVFYFSLLAVPVSAVPLLWAWRTPAPREWLLIALLGLFGTVGQLLMTRGYALGAASRLGPFTYFIVLFAALYGYLLWGETLDLWFVAGALLIVAGGLLAIRSRELTPAPAAS